MQDIFGSVRRSLVFRPSADNEETPPPVASTSSTTAAGAIVDKISSCIRRSRAFTKSASPSAARDTAPPIRWRKGELIGCGAFGRVYMGMNLDSGELLAVKQVLIAANSASKEKAQAHIRELEEEVKLLKNLSHPNIVRYLGTVREEETLNILLEFVPGGSISSLLGKFGAFPEAVIRNYTKQLLVGLEYLHKNGIMHRDIKGANILVDNKGCIKLADFGASKQATISGAKSMKGTPYWMSPEVILQTGHSFSADIWSVGCTIIEMATGKPPWSQQYQEVAALFHIGTTKAHPPIPDHLSEVAKDFLLKCLQKEPDLRPTASQLLQHPFVTGQPAESDPVSSDTNTEKSEFLSASCSPGTKSFQMPINPSTGDIYNLDNLNGSSVCQNLSSNMWGANNSGDDMCQIDRFDSVVGCMPDDLNKSFNPVTEPSVDWRCKFDETPELERTGTLLDVDQSAIGPAIQPTACKVEKKEFSFSCGPSLSEEEDELTESKIRAFLDEKAVELKKLQTPLYEEFYNTLSVACSQGILEGIREETAPSYLKLPPKSRSPSRCPIGTPSTTTDGMSSVSPGSNSSRRISNVGNVSAQSSPDVGSPQLSELKSPAVDVSLDSTSPSVIFSERQRKWKEELDQELERKREMMRQAVVGGKTSSPKDRALNRQRERTRFASPGK
ncbi:mitogen-activated protein kinase kinase kinase NPK1-like isoform X2 [Punica granatum]|uniref:mitogen-activated protein kinase kinase kinase n=1 Tax=Punica granatum TaxID=22663 RepID=A0A6P8C5J9_PUNGR|nr:mitogen-activated protein kinase kinase kinase NPK1-like isoform X2 [Punica granatum]